MTDTFKHIGIIGAGKLGITLARIARSYGFQVSIAGSGEPKKIALSVEVLVPGATALTAEQVAQNADIVVLAAPLGQYRTMPKKALKGKIVIDAMNYWWEIDGARAEILPDDQSSSEAVQEFLSDAQVVKAFNHIGYHDLFDYHRPKDAPDRRAVAIAGNDERSVKIVAEIVDQLGFDPLRIGKLERGVRLEPGSKAFGATVTKPELQKLINEET